jgi:VCBS repeat-containing protein
MPFKKNPQDIFRPSSHRFALESRQLFDGAAFVAAAAHAAEAPADTQHAAGLSRPSAEAPAAPVERVAPAPLAEAATAHAAPATAGAATDQHAVYVVDQNVQDWQQVVASIPKGGEIIYIDAGSDGVAQLASQLQGRHDISALYIVSHGADGEITLGSTTVTADNIASHAAEWQAIGAALTADGDILLYGCDVAQSGNGLLTQMASLTGADVAASTNATGASSRGGDWTLEASVGHIEAKAFSDGDYDGLLAAPTIKTTATTLTVSEPSVLNAAGAETGTLSGWTLTDDGTGNVTLDVVVADVSKGTLSSAQTAGVSTIAGGFHFMGTRADAQTWINQLKFTAADVELGNTAASTTITATLTDLDTPGIHAAQAVDVTITPSNDPTTIANGSQSVNEIGNTVLTVSTLDARDPEVMIGTQIPSQIVYAITANSQYGYLTVNGARLGVDSVFTQQDVIDGKVIYVHTATGADQNVADSFGIRVNDGATPSAQSATATISLNVTPLNQAPNVSGSGDVYEGQPANAHNGTTQQSVVGNFISADGGDDDADSTLRVQVTALPTDGTLYFTGTAVVNGVTTSFTNHAITATELTNGSGFVFAYTARAGLTYANNGQRDNTNTGTYPFADGFNVKVSDAGGGTGTPATTADTRITINVRPVNDDPTLISPTAPVATVTAAGDTAGTLKQPYVVTLTTAMLNATDVDSGDDRITFAVTSQAGLDQGKLLLNGKILPNGGVFTLADVKAGRVQYVQQGGAAAGDTDTFQFQVVDNTFGPRWNPDGTSIQRVGGVYDDKGTAAVGDDTLKTFTFTINLVQTANGNGGALDTQGTTTSHTDSNYAGVNVAGSSRGTLNEGGTVVLAGTGADFTTTPGLSYTAEGIPPSQVIYTILGLTDGGPNWNGALQLQTSAGVWVTLNVYDTFTQADLNAGNIRYVHNGASEDFQSSVQLSASAGVLTNVNGTLQPDAWNTTFTFFIRPTNDAPVASGSSNNVVAEGGTIAITTGRLNITDPDDATSESYLEGTATLPGTAGLPNYADNNDATGPNALKYMVDTLPTGGTLQYSTDGGKTWADVVAGVTQLDASTLTANAGTTGLRFVSDGSEVRSTSFTVHGIDRWGATSNTATVGIQITNVNDAPAIARDPTMADPVAGTNSPNNIGGQSVNEPLTLTEGGYAQITSAMLQAYDPDSSAQQVQYRITGAPAHGTIAYYDGTTFKTLGVGSSFSQADVAAGYIYYLNNGDESNGAVYSQAPGDKFTFDLGDGNKEQAGNAFWIYVTPANDPPVVTAPAGPVNLDSADVGKNPVPGFSVSDVDLGMRTAGETDYMQVTVRLLNSDGSPFTAVQYAALGGVTISVGGASGTTADADKNGLNDYLTLRGTQAQINAALATLDVTFGSDRDQLFQVQVIADDRLRDANGVLIANEANGGVQNQPAMPGKQLPDAIPGTEYDWYTATVPTNRATDGAIVGNIAASSVVVRASSVNEPGVLTGGSAATTFEDQATLIGPGLNIVVSDPESAAFGTPVSITLKVPSGTLGVGGAGADTSITLANGHVVTVAGDNGGTLVLTGLASDIQALLRDPTQGLTYKSAQDVNNDLNGTAAGDVTLTISFDDTGSEIGSDTGAGSVHANPANITVAIDITPVNDAPVVSGPGASGNPIALTGLTDVPGLQVSDVDYTDGGAPASTAGESDFMQVTVRITDSSGVPLAAGSYVDGGADAIVITSKSPAGVTVDGTYDGTGSALVIRGTLAQVNAYLQGLQVKLGGSVLSNDDKGFRVEVIADDRLRDLATGALGAGGAANGGKNFDTANGSGAADVPTTAVDPYGTAPVLPQNVSANYAVVFPTDVNDPAHITYTTPDRSESLATVQLGGIVITDSDALNGDLQATLTLPAGFTFAGTNSQTITLTGNLASLNAQVNALQVNLPDVDGAGAATAADWNGSFTVKIVVNDNGNNGARPTTLPGDTNNPNADPGDFDYADGTSNVLVTTRFVTVTVKPVNDAPLVINGNTQTLPAINEDVTAPAGDTVGNLFSNHYSDQRDQITNGGAVDATGGSSPDTFYGVAITGLALNPQQGVWQYSTDGGMTWSAVGARTDASALVLDASALVRFVPTANFFGTPNQLTVRLVENDANADGTSAAPVNGSTRDVSGSNNGGTTNVSADTVVLSTSVANVNDRPTQIDESLSAGTEDVTGTGKTVTTLFGGGYSDATDNQSGVTGGGNESTAFGGVAVVGNAATAAQGVWQYSTNGTTWTDVPTVSDNSALELAPDAQLRFVPAANFNGTPGMLTVRSSDVLLTTQSGVDISATLADQTSHWSTAHTLSTTVAPQNDAPVLSGTATSPTLTENNQTGTGVSLPTTSLLSGASVADLDLGTTGALASGVFGAGSIRVTLDNYQPGDLLFVTGTLPAGVTVTGGVAGQLTVNFDADTTVAEANAVLNALAYRSSSDNPTVYGAHTERNYTIVVNDGNNVQPGAGHDAGGPTSLDSNALVGKITIVAVNDPPKANDDVRHVGEDATTPINGNVITAGTTGEVADTDPDNVVGDLNVTAIRTGTEAAGTGTVGTLGTALAGSYGSLVIHADGSYTYTVDSNNAVVNALKDNQSLTEVYTYTISDGKGGFDTAQLSIVIDGHTDGTPTIAPVDGNGTAAGQVDVFEHGLVDGINGPDTSERNSGSINIAAADGLQSVTVGGTVVSLAQLNALGTTPLTIDTPDGTLVLTGFTASSSVGGVPTAGALSFTYTLKAAINNAVGETEVTRNVALVVTDAGNISNTGTLSVRIVDDTPTARPDTRSVTEDDAIATVNGNVVTDTGTGQDSLGADGAATGGPVTAVSFGGTPHTVGTAFASSYGTVTLNADGSYTYTLNNANPVVNALKNGQTLTEVVNYTITDKDGDTSTTTLTITINGHTDGTPAITPVDGNGTAAGQAEVFEHGLTDGFGGPDASERTTGSLTLRAADGLKSVTVGGSSFTLAQLQALGTTPQTVNTTDGTIVLTGFTPVTVNGIVTGGSLSYSYTLKAPITNAVGESEVTRDVALAITDAANITSTGTLTVRIVDDVPTANPDTGAVTEDGAALTGNIVTDTGTGQDRLGADGAATGGPVTAVSFGATTGTVGSALTTTYGSIVLSANGNYTYTLDNGNPVVNALKDGQTLTEVVHYTITDKDGDTSTTTLTITINGHTDGAPAITPVDGNGGSAGQVDVFEHGLTSTADTSETHIGAITIAAADGLKSISVGGSSFTLAQLQSLGTTPQTITTPEGTMVLTGFTPVTVNGIVTGGSLSYSYTLAAPIDNAVGETEVTRNVALAVTDAADITRTGTLTVRIVDDVPTANPDSGAVTEDGAALTGNVVTDTGTGQDRIGADGAALGGPVTGVSFGGTPHTVGTAFAATYGSVTLNADGSYTYTLDNANPTVNALKTGQSLTEVVSYTITDKDGDASTTTLTIAIAGHTDGDPVVTPQDGNGAGVTGQATVHESGLTPDGPAGESATTTGTLALSALDGLKSIQVEGTTLTLAQLQTLGTTPVAIDTGEGTLTLNGFTSTMNVDGIVTGGSVTYSYTLKAPVGQPGATDSTDAIALVVTDAANIAGTGTLTVQIVDDVPTARADINSVTEDGTATIGGNVVTDAGTGQDRLGADGAATGGPVTAVSFGTAAGTVGSALATTYGSVTLNADGSYTYTLNNNNAVVNALKDGDTLTEVVNYTITDKDGDTSSTTLTITIHGHTDLATGPSIVPVDNNGTGTGQTDVLEHGLTSVGDTTETNGGDIAISAADGLKTITVGGTTLTLTDLAGLSPATPVIVHTPQGTLSLTGFTGTDLVGGVPTKGTLTYSYTLDGQVSQPGATESTDAIALVVTDAGNASNPGTLTIRIVDDAPVAVNDVNSVTEDGPTVATGNVRGNDTLGADNANGVPVTSVSVGSVAGTVGAAVATPHGSIVVNADGSYTYTLNNADPAVQRLIVGETLTETVRYTITDADGDTSSATLTITIKGTNDVATLTLVDGNGAGTTGQATVSERGLGDPADASETTTGRFVIGTPDGLGSLTVGGTTLTPAQVAGLGSTPIVIDTGKGQITLTGFDPATGTVTYSYTLGAHQTHGGTDVTDDIAITVRDRDGDTTSGTLRVLVLDDVPTAFNDAAQVSTALPNGTVKGNVVGNGGGGDVADRIGADFTATPVTGFSFNGTAGTVGGAPLAGAYGTLRLSADGSYTYAVNDSNARVAALSDGQTLTEVFRYTITDSDGSTSTAQLTVTIEGATQFRPLADKVFPSDFVTPTRYITQGMEPALFVQHAVRASEQQIGELTATIAMNAAGGPLHLSEPWDVNTFGLPQQAENIEFVRAGIGFSQAMEHDVEQSLEQRGLGRGLPDGSNALFGDFPGFTATEKPAEAPAQKEAPRHRVTHHRAAPHGDASDVQRDAGRVAEAPAAPQTAVTPAARSFTERLAASAAERGTVRDLVRVQQEREAVRVKVPAAPV